MKTKYQVVYINGYLGINSNKAKVLQDELKDMNLEVRHIRVDYPKGNFDGSEIEEYFKNNEVNLIVASSMGAYIARYFAQKYESQLVSLNPLIDPSKSKNAQGITFDKKFIDFYNGYGHTVVVNKDDELIHYKGAVEKYTDHADVNILEHGGHRMSNFKDEVIPIIRKCINWDLFYMDERRPHEP